MENHKFVFICGLHKSGTSLLHRILRQHPSISGFSNTGVPKDEGQHLQTVYSTALPHGGPGWFGYSKRAYLDETSPLVNEKNRKKLFSQWSKYWDLSKPALIEKSPINLIRTRFLQAMFPNSFFIVLLRHPIAVSYATRKWWRWFIFTLRSLIKHWLICYEAFERDKEHLKNCYVLKYEHFVKNPQFYLNEIYNFIEVGKYNNKVKIRPDVNQKYFQRWLKDRNIILFKRNYKKAISEFEARVNKFGYSLTDLGKAE